MFQANEHVSHQTATLADVCTSLKDTQARIGQLEVGHQNLQQTVVNTLELQKQSALTLEQTTVILGKVQKGTLVLGKRQKAIDNRSHKKKRASSSS